MATGDQDRFPQKLWRMVNDKRYDKTIKWNEDGNGFFCEDQEKFLASKILEKYEFKHSSFSSFVRQLNNYGFHKNKQTRAYYHHDNGYFIREQPELLTNITKLNKKHFEELATASQTGEISETSTGYSSGETDVSSVGGQASQQNEDMTETSTGYSSGESEVSDGQRSTQIKPGMIPSAAQASQQNEDMTEHPAETDVSSVGGQASQQNEDMTETSTGYSSGESEVSDGQRSTQIKPGMIPSAAQASQQNEDMTEHPAGVVNTIPNVPLDINHEPLDYDLLSETFEVKMDVTGEDMSPYITSLPSIAVQEQNEPYQALPGTASQTGEISETSTGYSSGGPAEGYHSFTTKRSEMINIETACLKFQVEHKECVRVLPHTEGGQVVVHFYVFRDESGIPEKLKAAAQICFGEMKVKLKWSNLYNDSVNILNARSVEYPSDKPRRLNASQVDEISEIISENLHVFSKHRNVTAVQASFKVTKSKQTETPCITIYVLGKGYIPVGESEFPRDIGPYRVDVVDGFWFRTSDAPSNPNRAQENSKALLLGASIGVQGKVVSGSLGAIVKDEDSGRWYALSCDHVMKPHSEKSEIIHPGLDDHMEYLKYYLNEYGALIKKIIARDGGESEFSEIEEKIEDELISAKFEELKSKREKHCDSRICHPRVLQRMKKYEKYIETGLEPPRVIGNYTAGVSRNVKWTDGKEYFVDCAISELTEDEVTLLKKSEKLDDPKLINTEKYPSGECKPTTTDAIMKPESLCKSGKTGFSTKGYVASSLVYLTDTCKKEESCKKSRDSVTLFDVKMENKFHQACAEEQPTQMEAASPHYEACHRDSASLYESVWNKNCLCIASGCEKPFSGIGDSGAVVFEESDDVHGMPGFGMIFGLLKTSHNPYTLASPLQVALEALSKEHSKDQGFRQNLKLVSKYH